MALFTFFSETSPPFSLSSIILTTLAFPAATLWLAIFNALRSVPTTSKIRLRGAMHLWSGPKQLELVVEGVVVKWWWRCRSCSVEILRRRWCSTEMRWRSVRSWVGTIEGCPPTMSCSCCRGVLRRDPYATQDHKMWSWGSCCVWAWTGSPCMKSIFLYHQIKKLKDKYIIWICSVLVLIYSKYVQSADCVMSGQKKLYKASFMHAAWGLN